MNDLKELEKYTCIKVYLANCPQPAIIEGKNSIIMKMKRIKLQLLPLKMVKFGT